MKVVQAFLFTRPRLENANWIKFGSINQIVFEVTLTSIKGRVWAGQGLYAEWYSVGVRTQSAVTRGNSGPPASTLLTYNSPVLSQTLQPPDRRHCGPTLDITVTPATLHTFLPEY